MGTYVEQPAAKFTRQLVHCDMDSLDSNAIAVGFTYQKCKGCKAVMPYGEANGDCPARGLEMVRWTENNHASKEELMEDPEYAPFFANDTIPSDEYVTDMYLCGTNDETVAAAKGHESMTNTISEKQITKAEA